MILTFRPIDRWPDGWDRTNPPEKPTPFMASYSDTLTILEREVEMLDAREVFLQVDARADQVRIDGALKANASIAYPGVILTIDTRRFGVLTYPCNAFGTTQKWIRTPGEKPGYQTVQGWQANLRAIALGLEALRKVERYGIAERGQQYAGFAQIGSGIAMGAAPHAMTESEAMQILIEGAGYTLAETEGMGFTSQAFEDLFRKAAKIHHPDAGGDPEVFRKLTEARDLLLGGKS